MAVAFGRRAQIKSGPWTGVWDTPDPFDGGPKKLLGARNLYNPDPENGSGSPSRPGFAVLNGGAPIYSSLTPFKGQGAWTHFDVNGTAYNFIAMGGHLFREDPATTLLTDVTPVGVAIDGSTTTRVGFGSLGGTLAVTDGVHRPWVASNLDATPITGTYIDFDGAGGAWIAFGPPTVYGGAGFWVLTSANGTAARLDIAWTEPSDWTRGYQQTDFDNRWTLEQTGTGPIFAIQGTNVSLNYWRQRSIGSISGTVGIDLATTATHDAISSNVGSESPFSIVQFANSIYFCDAIGRPWRFALGGKPEPIWQQLRGIVDVSEAGFPGVTARVTTATFEPTLNLYCVAIWSPVPSQSASPTEWYVFDANTGVYLGAWSIGPATPGVSVDFLGTFTDGAGGGTLVVLGSLVAGGPTGYAWGMSGLVGVPDFIVLEDGTTFLSDESTPAVLITSEGQAAVFKDNNDVPVISATTDRLGYSEDVVWFYDSLTILTGSPAPITVTATTPNAANVLQGTPTPNPSADGIYRTQMGLDLQGRGIEITVQPTTADRQWSLQRVTVTGVPNPAAPDDA